ncbi:MAG: hypothetical protein HYZ17_04210 [Betaproteobacteria bacterium]|nr:hypothetical protein [Betaproteobacteria bacterium]
MSDEKRTPATNAKTGEVHYSDPAPRGAPQKQATSERQKRPEKDQIAGEEAGGLTQATNSAATATTGTVGKRGKSKPKAEITTLEQFIAHAYALKGRKVPLKAKVERQIAQDPTLSEETLQRLKEVASKDTTLAAPRQLLLAARQVTGYPGLRGAIRDFVRDTLLMHPIFLHERIDAAIRNLDEAPGPGEVLKQIAETEAKDLPQEFVGTIKATELEQLRTNAVYCMAIWLAESRGLSVAAVADVLFTSLWAPKAQKLVAEASKLDAVSSIAELAGVGLACDEYRRLAQVRLRASESATNEAEVLRARVQTLESDIDALRLKASELEETHATELQAHQTELESLRLATETEAAHLRNDLELQRTRLLRRLKSDVHLLEEGLQAFTRPKPKVHVMVDHAERVTDALRQEIKNLQGE